MYLQNQQVGWNTNGSEYKAHYVTQNAIIIGEQVTSQTNIAPYEILSNGNISCQATDSISIKPGFYSKSGSQFHAYIQPPTCSYYYGGPSAKVINEQSQNNLPSYKSSNQTLNYITKYKVTSEFIIIPNLNNGSFNLLFNTPINQFALKIFDLSGKMVYFSNTNDTQIDYLILEKGVYLVLIETDNKIMKQKLIIN